MSADYNPNSGPLTGIGKVRQALRVTTDAYDEEILDLMEAAKLDLGIAGVEIPEEHDALIQRAIITYVKLHFGDVSPEQFKLLQASYDAQKGQLQIATGYTDWSAT